MQERERLSIIDVVKRVLSNQIVLNVAEVPKFIKEGRIKTARVLVILVGNVNPLYLVKQQPR